MALEFTTSYVADATSLFRYYKRLADEAIAQLDDEALFQRIDPDSNSIAILMSHMAGNMRSRFTEFLTSDGEKPWRNRDREFDVPPETREALLAQWAEGWGCVFGALEGLTEADLIRTVTVRGEAHSVMQAVNRQLAHYPHHVGQIVLLAKHFAGAGWKTLSVAKGASADFNRRVESGELSQR